MGNGAPERGFVTTLSCIFWGMLPGVMGLNKHHCAPNCVPMGMGQPTPNLGRRFIYQSWTTYRGETLYKPSGGAGAGKASVYAIAGVLAVNGMV